MANYLSMGGKLVSLLVGLAFAFSVGPITGTLVGGLLWLLFYSTSMVRSDLAAGQTLRALTIAFGHMPCILFIMFQITELEQFFHFWKNESALQRNLKFDGSELGFMLAACFVIGIAYGAISNLKRR